MFLSGLFPETFFHNLTACACAGVLASFDLHNMIEQYQGWQF